MHLTKWRPNTTMERIVLLIYGEKVPPTKHIGKMARKYAYYYNQDKNNQDFHSEHYYEVTIDTWYTGLEKREGEYSQVTVVKKEYLLQFIIIFKNISSNVTICSENHEHPFASISGMEFEGYCYYLKDGTQKIIFLSACWIEKSSISKEEQYKLWIESKLNKNPDWSIFSPKVELQELRELDWYKGQTKDNRWLIIGSNKNTNKEFDRWIKGLMLETKKRDKV
jgi:hypothetical protein